MTSFSSGPLRFCQQKHSSSYYTYQTSQLFYYEGVDVNCVKSINVAGKNLFYSVIYLTNHPKLCKNHKFKVEFSSNLR